MLRSRKERSSEQKHIVKRGVKRSSFKSLCVKIQELISSCFMFFLSLKLRKSYSGMVLILFVITVPLLMYGVKYSIDTMTQTRVQLEKGKGEYHKECAKLAAYYVAKNWNPGLTLSQQKDAVLKVADAVYNANPCFNDSIIGRAVPGVNLRKAKKPDREISAFEPIPITFTESSASKLIYYSDKTKYLNRYSFTSCDNNGRTLWNPNFAMYWAVDKNTNPEYRVSVFDEINVTEAKKANYVLTHQDIFISPVLRMNGHICSYDANKVYYPNNSYYAVCHPEHAQFWVSIPDKTGTNSAYAPSNALGTCPATVNSTVTSTYKQRVASEFVQVSIENDKIKVQTDKQIGYAVPAKCNVDIVLAIPVNGAANNVNNRDAASDTAGTPTNGLTATNSVPADVQSTPIYQMSQACRSFIKNNFYHTRGVNMGLIPYSGKVSLSPDKASSYTVWIPNFSSDYFRSYPFNFKRMCGAALYGTRGEKNVALSSGYYWGNKLMAYPIMCRQGAISSFYAYGNNQLAYGDLFSTLNPTTNALKFRRMNLKPCYMGYSNMLSQKCERNCQTYLPNPYYMVELTADVTKIYELCNAMYPIYDLNNVSNFIFIPVTWANNFFQSWTSDPSAAASTNQLSRESKTTLNRKKALILIVNKPDWFEPGELTYLGFDNDYSDFPIVESDKIGFDINYSDTSKKFLDGSAFDGTIQGPKKILKFSRYSGTYVTRRVGFYEVDNGTYRLKFSEKGLLKIVVAPSSQAEAGAGYGYVKFFSDNIGSSYNVRKDSLSGSAVSLNSNIPIMGTQTFVFSGGSLPPSVQDNNRSHGSISSYGRNFEQNLTTYKVRYALQNASITNCILKNQILRYYGGMYTDVYGPTWESNRKKPLILNTGGTDSRTAYYDRYSGVASAAIYDPYPEYKDTCVTFTTSAHYNCCHPAIRNYTTRIYGVKKATNFVNFFCNGATFYYLVSGGSEQNLGTWTYFGEIANMNVSSYTSYYQNNSDPSVQFRAYNSADTFTTFGFLVKNYYDKTFIKDISNNDLLYNRGVGLQNLSSSIGVTPAGDWICFQGDGDLYVTVTGGCGLRFTNVSGDYDFHEVKETTTIYVEPSKMSNAKIDGDYYVEFEAGALKLISAEITNREYERVAPTCYIQGATNTLRSSGTAYIVTNCKHKMVLRAKTTPKCQVTFYSDGGVTQNVGTYTLDNTRSFTFAGYSSVSSSGGYVAGPNFGTNYGINKIRYSAQNATISAYVAAHSQLLRYSSAGMDKSLVIYNRGEQITSYRTSYGDAWTIMAVNQYRGHPYYKTRPLSSGFKGYYSRTTQTATRYPSGDVYGNSFPSSSWSALSSGYYYSTLGISENGPYLNLSSGTLLFYLKNPPSYDYLDFFYFRTCLQIPWGGMNRSTADIESNLCVSATSSYIQFSGDGTCVVNVTPTGSNTGYIRYTTKSGGSGSVPISTYNSYTTVTIDPANYKFEGNADGSFYFIKLDLENISIDTSYGTSGVAFATTPDYIYRYKKIDQTGMNTRYTSYGNSITMTPSGYMGGTFSTFLNPIDGTRGISSSDSGQYIRDLTAKSLHGDLTHITEDVGSYSTYMYLLFGDYSSYYYLQGSMRLFSPMWRSTAYPYLSMTEYSGLSGSGTTKGGAATLLTTHATYPVNFVLFYSGYQSNYTNVSPTQAVSLVTSAACAKLKADHPTTLRVYVIKYRKQEMYNAIPIKGETSKQYHDYSIVDQCATSGKVYEATTQASLKSTLDTIAADIKNFAGYEKEKNVN